MSLAKPTLRPPHGTLKRSLPEGLHDGLPEGPPEGVHDGLPERLPEGFHEGLLKGPQYNYNGACDTHSPKIIIFC